MKAGNFKREIAEAISREAHVGFPGNGGYFAVDTDNDGECDGVYWRSKSNYYNPWHDGAIYVSVMAFADEWNDYSDEDGDTDEEDMIAFIMDTMLEESVEID